MTSRNAAVASLVTGASVWFLWTAFVHVKESSVLGLSQAIFGTPAVLEGLWQAVDPLIIALPLSTLVLLGGMALERARAETGEKTQDQEGGEALR